MPLSKEQLWERFKKYYVELPTIKLAIDISRMNFAEDFFQSMAPRMEKAFHEMAELEKGAIANPDENRMVGHYWLRNPDLAPSPAIRDEIKETVAAIKSFASQVHEGGIQSATGPFKNLLVIGIGGSALGPQFVAHALGNPATDKMRIYFFDNTDPDGMDRVISQIDGQLGQTLCLVISKSGGTKETRNGMLEAQAAYVRAGLRFEQHAVAITRAKSELDLLAVEQAWLKRFPMWDWVGGRTSVTSAVGLLPAALQGFDIDGILAGARSCDDLTRRTETMRNPAALIALMIHYSGNGKGDKAMVVLPYKDRLELFSKYLQQLVMESLGKEKDLNGLVVRQGLMVFGNKGSTDQHAYVQQLRDGLSDFFAVFVEVLKDRSCPSIMVEPGVTSGDYLLGFLLGTRNALYENRRESITITLVEVSSFTVGVLIALFERTIGFYASLVNVNAYHQPGVEAGKKAAENVIELQTRILKLFAKRKGIPMNSADISKIAGALDQIESVFKICEHLSTNVDHGVKRTARLESPFDSAYVGE